ncbi:MAG TPA: cell envelope integrity protein TolA [Steroidobacteraceae bacterium]|nr:cell envelope integrity protein TolA [Steroidobacteraceae bacterium]
MLLHGVLVAVLVYGWLRFRHPPPPVSALAIDATVVSQATLDAAQRPVVPPQPAPSAPPAPVAPAAPPQAAEPAVPPPEATQEQAQVRAEAARREAAAHAAAEEAAQEKAARARAQALAAQALAARKAAAKAEALAKAQARAEAAAKAQAAASEADLQRNIAAEEKLDAARASGALSSWAQQIQARIQRAWIRPPSARSGLECTLYVTQVPGGEVVNVRLGSCNGDDAVRQSILDAAYRASPLPAPSDPSLFERNLEVTFRPTD